VIATKSRRVAGPRPEEAKLWKYHKPGRSEDVPQGFLIGMMDVEAEGLILVSDDMEVARLLELASVGWVRRYWVRAERRAEDDALKRLADGANINGIHYGPMHAEYKGPWLEISLRESGMRSVRRVAYHLRLEPRRILRVGFGPFELDDLAKGVMAEMPRESWLPQLGGKFGAANADRRR
jgi:23S rRNA pseudouridine2605 synthase